jgi:integrase
VRASTLESYAAKVRLYVVPTLGHVPLQKLTPAHMQACYSALLKGDQGRGQAGVSARTVRYVHAILHRALKEAVGLGLVSRNVTDAVAPPKAPRPPIKSWDVADVRRFLEAAATDEYSPIWLIALHTGMRRGELLGLRWQDVDLAHGVLRVCQSATTVKSGDRFTPPKTASGRRTIALDTSCVVALREHRVRQNARRLALGAAWQDYDLVFASEIGTPLNHANVYHRFVKLSQRAGVSRIPFHDLRHTHATLLMKHGVHPKVASERLGHADITLTQQTYSHVLPQMQQQAADIVASAVAQGVL